MVIYTNKNGLPESFFNAVTRDTYDRGDSDITATQLIDPPQIYWLGKSGNDVEEDVSERVWALLGQSIHSILERNAPSDHMIVEKRFYKDVRGWKVGGQVDLFDMTDGTITDWKVTSAWTIVYGSRIEDWEWQLNILAALARANGHTVKALKICALLRDWAQRDADRGGAYPQSPIVEIDIPLWTPEEADEWLDQRVALFQESIDTPDAPPACTQEERWFNKKTGKYIRCEKYCRVRAFCPQREEK